VLIGVSFTSVVGYRIAASDVKASPLFNIRTSRAIDVESEDLRCEYVGKGDIINLLIPKIDSRTALIQEVIDIISKMDEKRFNKLVDFIKSKENLFNGELRDDKSPLLFTIDGSGFQECLIQFIIDLVISIIVFISDLILSILLKLNPTNMISCPTSICKECMTLQL
jgi:hypothetical protein